MENAEITTEFVRTSSYEYVVTRELVEVLFPESSALVARHEYGNPRFVVPKHYHRGIASFGLNGRGKPIYININYYGFGEKHLGKKVVAKVRIQRKIVIEETGTFQYIIVNVIRDRKKEDLDPLFRLQFGILREVITDHLDEAVLIPETGTEETGRFVRFKRLP